MTGVPESQQGEAAGRVNDLADSIEDFADLDDEVRYGLARYLEATGYRLAPRAPQPAVPKCATCGHRSHYALRCGEVEDDAGCECVSFQPAVPDGAAGEVEALAAIIGTPRDLWTNTARRVLASDWFAERLAEARADEADKVSEEWAERLDRGIATGVREGRRQGAASVRARVEAMMRKAAHRVLSLHYSEPERFERETLRLAHDLSVQADELRAVASGGDDL